MLKNNIELKSTKNWSIGDWSTGYDLKKIPILKEYGNLESTELLGKLINFDSKSLKHINNE